MMNRLVSVATVLVLAIMVGLSVIACDESPPSIAQDALPDRARPSPTPAPAVMADRAEPSATPVPTMVPPTPVPVVMPDRAKPSASDSELDDLVSGNSAFAFDLYRTLSSEDGNLFYSPYSISIALGMTYAGARGETERQMADTLYFDLPQDTLHPAFNTLYLDLNSRSGGKQDNDPSAFRLNVANALWGRQDYQFLDEFTNVIGENYGAAVRLTDFVGQPEESRVRINDWVANETEDRITDLIPPGKFEERPPALVLTNAIYFNAAWVRKFKPMPTPTDFHKLDGETVAAPMMNRSGKRQYTSGDGYQAVDLLYSFSKMSMTILLPDSGTFEAFEKSLDDELVARMTKDLEARRVVLTMPKFEFESTFDLVETLMTIGMSNAFDSSRADLSGMDGRSCMAGDVQCLFLSDVIHKAFVAVDEEGTEAAAATASIAMPVSGAPGPPVEVIVDRPFIFLIRDRSTGTILFVGRVLDPSA